MGALLTLPYSFVEANHIPVYDLIIVGSGAAGMSCAYYALKGGIKRILLLEKEALLGGSSIICGGQFAIAGTKMQRRNGIKDSEDIFYEDMLITGGHRNVKELVRTYVQEVKYVYEDLAKSGIHPKTLMASSGMSLPRSHTFNATEVMEFFIANVTPQIELKTTSKLFDLLSENGIVKGVSYILHGKIHFAKSRLGVVLATGGFVRNSLLMDQYAPGFKNVTKLSGIGCNGDGLLLAQKYGAELADMDSIKASYGFTVHPSSIRDFSTVYYAGGILVNREGKRFVNESLSYKILADAALKQNSPITFIIFDENMRQIQMHQREIDHALWLPFSEGKKVYYAHQSTAIKNLAQMARIDPEGLLKTIQQYNQDVKSGGDKSFGRQTLTFTYGKALPLEKPPFYAMPAVSAIMGTYCGVLINNIGQVMDKAGMVIPGLFAAGEVTGGLHGQNYITGTGFGKALTFGSIIGKFVSKKG